MTLALDISHFTESTSGPLTTRQLSDAWDLGVRAFRPSIANQDVAVRQIDAIVNHGDATGQKFNIWTYRYYYFGMSLVQADEDKAFIQRVRDLKYNIQLHGIDIEDTNPDINTPARIREIEVLIQQFEGFCPTDLYTACWYWTYYIGNTPVFNFMPLWFAGWDGIPNLEVNPSFGGYTKGHMKQYAGNQYFAGIWCDLNYYEETVPPPIPPTPTPPIEESTVIKVSTDKLYRFEFESDNKLYGLELE